jgi:hypothetical protein
LDQTSNITAIRAISQETPLTSNTVSTIAKTCIEQQPAVNRIQKTSSRRETREDELDGFMVAPI